MARGKSTDNLLAQGEQLARVWEENPSLSLGNVTLAQFQTRITELRNKRAQADTLRTQLTAVVNDANTLGDDLADLITRAQRLPRLLRPRLHAVRAGRRDAHERPQTTRAQTANRHAAITGTPRPRTKARVWTSAQR